MPRTLVAALCIALTLTASDARANTPARAMCPGMRADLIEQKLSREIRRFAFEGQMLTPFLELWRAGRRPVFSAQPERVNVWAVPKHPYIVGFERSGCILAFLKVDRRKLWQALRVQIGWPA